MRFKLSSPIRLTVLAITCVLFVFTTVAAHAKDLKFEAQLIWATTAETSPNPDHKPADAETRKKLDGLGPWKWKNYFIVKKIAFTVPEKNSKEVILSEKCRIRIKDIDAGKNFEVALIGKGEAILKRTQPLPQNELLVLGGNAPDSTAWLVVLKRVE